MSSTTHPFAIDPHAPSKVWRAQINRLTEVIATIDNSFVKEQCRARLNQALADRMTTRLDGLERGLVAPIKLIQDVA
jgi:hypothetical protein